MNEMSEFDQVIHRTWVQLLVDHGYREAAAIAIDMQVYILYSNYAPDAIVLDVPISMYSKVKNDESLKTVMERALLAVCHGHLYDQNNDSVSVEDLPIEYRVKLVEVEDGWQNIVRKLIVNSEDPNQGLVTEKVFSRRNKQPYIYNEMKFASKTEIRIAQEFEARGVLFFPLPLAVRAKTGNFYEDHREVDFLVCEDGTWGILEVSYHPDRYEKDAEKDAWFKKSGILCIQHYSAERCYENPAQVVDEFQEILSKHKR